MSLFAEIKELREKRAKCITDAGVMLSESDGPLTGESLDKFNTAHSEGDRLMSEEIAPREKQWEAQKELDAIQDVQPTDTRTNRQRGKDDDKDARMAELREKSIRSLCLNSPADLTAEERAEAKSVGVDFAANRISFDLLRSGELREFRAQAAGTDAKGGFTVPEDSSLIGTVENALLAYGGMRTVSRVVRTDGGGDLPIPTVNDTTNVGSILAENTQASAQDITFAQTVLQAYMYTSDIVLASIQFLQDTAINAGAFIGDALGTRIGRINNTHFTTGTGTAQPRGFVTAALANSATVAAAGATAITYADLIGLIHGLDPAYRGNARLMMNDAIIAVVRQILDGNSRPLWSPSVVPGVPDTLLGYQVETNQDMDSTVATTKETIAFGDFSKYMIRDVRGVTIQVLRERYADYLQVGFHGFMRTDGDLIDAGTKPIMLLQQ